MVLFLFFLLFYPPEVSLCPPALVIEHIRQKLCHERFYARLPLTYASNNTKKEKPRVLLWWNRTKSWKLRRGWPKMHAE